jgi:hypothetical protein
MFQNQCGNSHFHNMNNNNMIHNINYNNKFYGGNYKSGDFSKWNLIKKEDNKIRKIHKVKK